MVINGEPVSTGECGGWGRPGELEWEKRILQCIQHGTVEERQAAFGALHEHYAPGLTRLVARRGVPSGDREDIVQQVWFIVLSKIDTFQARGYTMRPWLSAIAGVLIKEYWRKAKRHARRELPYDRPGQGSGDETVWEEGNLQKEHQRERHELQSDRYHGWDHPDGDYKQPLSREEKDRLMHLVVKDLEDPYRRIVMLKYFGGLSFDAIAAQLGMNPSTVRVYHKRALERLRRIPSLRGLFDQLC